jgi:TonB family protein
VKSRKINIMKTTPEFTDAEIRDMMDFQQVLTLRDAAHARSRKIVKGVATTALIAGLAVGGFFTYKQYTALESNPQSSQQSQSIQSTDPPVPATQDSTGQPVIAEPQVVKQPPARSAATDSKKSAQEKQQPIVTEAEVTKGEAVVKEEASSQVRVDSVTSVFLPAEPVDGYPALYDYFARQLRYPEQAIKDSIQGVISVSFVINAEGKPERVTTDHALGEAFEQEAIRLIENMPAWRPAQLDGSPVRSRASVPIRFSIKTVKTK